MTNEHQPGSPGVDLDALERRLELDLGSWGNSKKYAAVFAELRTLRARVESYAMDLAALEGTNAAKEGALRVQLERLHGERFRAESAEARVRELEIELLGFEVSARKKLERITTLESQLEAAREETRWRKVAERPAEEDFVLAWCEGESIRRIWFSKRLGFEVLGPANSEPTHWLPLPRPPAILEVEAKGAR